MQFLPSMLLKDYTCKSASCHNSMTQKCSGLERKPTAHEIERNSINTGGLAQHFEATNLSTLWEASKAEGRKCLVRAVCLIYTPDEIKKIQKTV